MSKLICYTAGWQVLLFPVWMFLIAASLAQHPKNISLLISPKFHAILQLQTTVGEEVDKVFLNPEGKWIIDGDIEKMLRSATLDLGSRCILEGLRDDPHADAMLYLKCKPLFPTGETQGA